jgi:putative SOS response-associated peptidase YedK
MCSEYVLKIRPEAVEEALGTPIISHSNQTSWDMELRMGGRAPVIVAEGDKLYFETLRFPTSPFPNARLSGFRNQSDGNDFESRDEADKEITRIYDKKLWKEGFATKPLLTPMTRFREFAYWGERKGDAIDFEIPGEDVFFAASIGIGAHETKWEKARREKLGQPKPPQEQGFAIITHTATEEMLQVHQRLIVIFKAEDALGYLAINDPLERFQYIVDYRYAGHLKNEKQRTMAKGWDARVGKQIAKREREMNFRQALETEGVLA